MSTVLTYIGVRSDLDSVEVRAAIAVPSRRGTRGYLDGDVPMKYKLLRKVPGEPVPQDVLVAMELVPHQPWVVPDRMLEEMGWSPEGIPWAEWKPQKLNKMFQEQGVAGQPAKVTAPTMEHGEREKK